MKILQSRGKILNKILTGQISGALRGISLYCPGWLFRFNKGWMMYTDSVAVPGKLNPEVQVRVATGADAEDVVRISDIDKDTFIRLHESGVTCLLATLNGGNPSAVAFFCSGKIFIKGLALKYDFGADGSYGFWFKTLPEFRNKGLNNSLMVFKCELERETGRKYRFCFIESENQLSYDIQIKAGYKPIISLFFIKLFFLRFSIAENIENGSRKISLFTRPPGDGFTVL